MAEEYQTLTSEMDLSGPESSTGIDTSKDPDKTVETTPEGALKTDDGKGKEPTQDADGKQPDLKEPGKPGPDAGDDFRFDKHPRWQEMIKERNAERERAIALEAELKAHKELVERFREQQKQPETKVEKPAKDYEAEFRKLDKALDIGDIDINEHRLQSGRLFREQAREEAKALAESRVGEVLKEYQAKEQQRLEEERQRSVRDKQAKWLSENPKFNELSKDGTLERIRREDPFGLHDDYSAYLVWKASEEKAAAVKEAEEKLLANLKAKRDAQTLASGPSATPSEPRDPAMKDSKKFGGRTSVLAGKLAAMRRAAGSG